MDELPIGYIAVDPEERGYVIHAGDDVWLPCDGRMVPKRKHRQLYSVLRERKRWGSLRRTNPYGETFSLFALPSLRTTGLRDAETFTPLERKTDGDL